MSKLPFISSSDIDTPSTTARDKTQWEIEIQYPDQDHAEAHGERVLSNRKRTVNKFREDTALASRAS